MRPSSEDLADSLTRSRFWRSVRPYLFSRESGSQYLSQAVREYLAAMAWIEPVDLSDAVEDVTHILRQRMAKKAAVTRKRRTHGKQLQAQRERQYELF